MSKSNDYKNHSCEGGLWLTSGKRIVLDNHGEVFSEPYDKLLMSVEELTQGIPVKRFKERFCNV